MKRVLVIAAIVMILLAVALIVYRVSRDDVIQAVSAKGAEVEYVQILMPDGTVISGECTNYFVYGPSGIVWVTIHGTEYCTHSSRVVEWKEGK